MTTTNELETEAGRVIEGRTRLLHRDNVAEWGRQMVFEAVTKLTAELEDAPNRQVREAVFDHVDSWMSQLYPGSAP